MTSTILRLLSAAMLAVLIPVSARASSSTSDRPLVIAHTMHCYLLGFSPEGAPAGSDPDSVDNWPPHEQDNRTAWASSIAGLNNQGKAGILHEFEMAHDAGLDAFALLVGTDHLPRSQFAAGMKCLAEVAQTDRVKIMPDLWAYKGWDNMSDEQIRNYGQRVKDFMDAYPDAFLKRDGKWMINMGNAFGWGRGRGYGEWAHARHFFDPWAGTNKFYITLNIWFEDPSLLEGGWGNAVDAFGMWTGDLGWGDQDQRGAYILPNIAKTYGKQVIWPIHTTYYGFRPQSHAMAENLGVTSFCDLWRRAITAKMPFVQVQTWNDFSEDHAITDTNLRGRSMLILNRYFADWYHDGKPPAVSTERVFLFRRRQLARAALSQATVLAENLSWRKTPTVDYLNVVTILKRPAKITLNDGTGKWQIDAPRGLHEWLVYAPSPRTAPGQEHEAYTRADGSSYPVTTPERTVTSVEAIPSATPEVSVMRKGATVLSVRSKMPLLDTARWQDLSTIGDMAPGK
ncbi:MAG: endo-1,3-alpha-glucanase family glycosylhydrolase [Capsulimonadaceae bacterium]|nr:endo-1,3-alpha-glucanase family glycosylhydrolase [Capsulimonadaceae bacterium]